MIITITVTGIFYALKVANVKPSKASLDTIDIMKLAGGLIADVLVKDYAVYMDQRVIQQQNFIALSRPIKSHDFKCKSILRSAPPRHVRLTHV